jgi:hypothetical protein
MKVRLWGLEKSKVFDGFSRKRGFRQGTTRFSRHHYYRINTCGDGSIDVKGSKVEWAEKA